MNRAKRPELPLEDQTKAAGMVPCGEGIACDIRHVGQ